MDLCWMQGQSSAVPEKNGDAFCLKEAREKVWTRQYERTHSPGHEHSAESS